CTTCRASPSRAAGSTASSPACGPCAGWRTATTPTRTGVRPCTSRQVQGSTARLVRLTDRDGSYDAAAGQPSARCSLGRTDTLNAQLSAKSGKGSNHGNTDPIGTASSPGAAGPQSRPGQRVHAHPSAQAGGADRMRERMKTYMSGQSSFLEKV